MTETFDYSNPRKHARHSAVLLSYSRPEQRWLNHNIIRAVEGLSGQPHLERLYHDWAANPD